MVDKPSLGGAVRELVKALIRLQITVAVASAAIFLLGVCLIYAPAPTGAALVAFVSGFATGARGRTLARSWRHWFDVTNSAIHLKI